MINVRNTTELLGHSIVDIVDEETRLGIVLRAISRLRLIELSSLNGSHGVLVETRNT